MASILFYIILFTFTLVYLIPFILLFLVTFPFDKERVLLHRASRLWSRVMFGLCPLWKRSVEGLEKIDKKKSYVVVTNHQSMLDIPMMYILPLNFKWVSKKEVLRWPIFGLVLRMHGDITIARGESGSAKKMMNQAQERLANGTSIILFPEGTRSRDGSVGRFKEGAFVMAKSNGVEILPVVSLGTGAATKGWRLRVPHSFRIKVLEPISVQEVAQKDARMLAAEVEQLMRTAHREMTSKG